jgi:adenosylmethionine-8-amino-7-oxononanoate aminotransferase
MAKDYIKGIFITGTDTGVGKTIVTALISHILKSKSIDVGVMKPVETGGRSDSNLIKAISNSDDDIDLINPYYFRLPLSPNIASKFEGVDIDIGIIKERFSEISEKHEIVLVEGIGGLLVPIRDNYYVLDLIRDFDLPIIVVSRASIGTINHTLLTIKYSRIMGIKVLGFIINNCTDGISERTNPEIIERLSNTENLGIIPHIPSISQNGEDLKNVFKSMNIPINLDNILYEERIPIKELEQNDKKYIWHPFTQMKDYLKENPLIIKEGKGAKLRDMYGNEYIDGVSSLWVNTHGHRRKEIDEALIGQIGRISHSTLLGPSNIPAINLAKKLVDITPEGLNKVFYSDNGSTAVEIALKLSFQYWKHKGYNKSLFVCFNNGYHGDTIGAVSVGGIELFHNIYSPLLFNSIKSYYPYCYRCSFNKFYPGCSMECLDLLDDIVKKNCDRVAALIIEPMIQGAGGMIVAPEGFLKGVRKICSKYNILMIADEVATGFGRTGKMFACEHEGVKPDLMAIAKGITGGYLPLAATLTTDEIYNEFLGEYEDKKTFFHGHTYTGNPLACSAAIANLDIFEKDNFFEELDEKIKYLKKLLEPFNELSHVGEVRQLGFMVGIELVRNKMTKEEYEWKEKIGIRVILKAREKGLIIRPLGNVVVLMPPFIISYKDLKEMIDIVYESIIEVTEKGL